MKFSFRFLRPGILLLLAIVGLFLLRCAAVQDLAKIQKPLLALQGVRITSLNFESVGLAFDVKIDNPNALSVTMAGFDYDFLLNDASFIKGQQDTSQRIEANGSSQLVLPVNLNFKDLYNTYQMFKDQDSSAYQLNCGLNFDLPIIGKTRIPLQTKGFLPLPKIPKLQIQALKLKKMGLTGADLELVLDIENPNAFGVNLNKLNYDFAVAGQTWVDGTSQSKMAIDQKGSALVNIPISLNFLKMGQTVMKLLSGENNLDYDFSGALDFNTSLPVIGEVNLPVKKTGSINLQR